MIHVDERQRLFVGAREQSFCKMPPYEHSVALVVGHKSNPLFLLQITATQTVYTRLDGIIARQSRRFLLCSSVLVSDKYFKDEPIFCCCFFSTHNNKFRFDGGESVHLDVSLGFRRLMNDPNPSD